MTGASCMKWTFPAKCLQTQRDNWPYPINVITSTSNLFVGVIVCFTFLNNNVYSGYSMEGERLKCLVS